jgi:hypothetical protein
MLHADARALRRLALHFVFRPAHRVAHFTGQGLALTGSQRWNRCQADQHLHPKNRSRNSIRVSFNSHSAFVSCEIV